MSLCDYCENPECGTRGCMAALPTCCDFTVDGNLSEMWHESKNPRKPVHTYRETILWAEQWKKNHDEAERLRKEQEGKTVEEWHNTKDPRDPTFTFQDDDVIEFVKRYKKEQEETRRQRAEKVIKDAIATYKGLPIWIRFVLRAQVIIEHTWKEALRTWRATRC